MIPEAELIRKEFIIRELDTPPSISMTKKSLLRWVCLSLGLISKNETRDKGFLVFDSLFNFIFSKKINPTTLDLQASIKEKYNIEMSEKLIRYHLNRIIDLGLLKRENNKYYINSSPVSENRNSISESFSEWTKPLVEKEIKKITVKLSELEKAYSQ
ncbi:MAG: hypothetical protein PHQ98_04800 [Candidatus ainarchaeum sp.]|nr:hypothetical protein [Candidatus ainarchaeum sp.]